MIYELPIELYGGAPVRKWPGLSEAGRRRRRLLRQILWA